jgi:hypothetical protein
MIKNEVEPHCDQS